MKTLRFAAMLLLAAGLLAGCCNCNRKSANYPFKDTVWELTQLDGKSIKADNNFTLAFGSDNRIGGRGSCNTFFGTWEEVAETENGINVGPVASTMMLCPDNETEHAFFRMLEDVTEYRMDRGNLFLYQGDVQRAILKGTAKRVN